MTLERPKPIKRETLADQVASDLTRRILASEFPGGAALPTEPQLSEEYEVSRSVIRDATRLLAARGLVDVRHGKGVFVTSSQKGPLADALLLALRRDGATAWDVDQFMDWLVIVAVSMATSNATDEEIEEISRLGGVFLESLAASNEAQNEDAMGAVARRAEQAFDRFYGAILDATHNVVLQHVVAPLLALRRLREWDLSRVVGEPGVPDLQTMDRRFQEAILDCLRSRDPSRAAAVLHGFFELPHEAIDVLKRTPVGEVARIVLPSTAARRHDKEAK
jgi:GntR family transcriptional regulator, transcriptional repressor for pyruvate dehydrogenase complex